MGRPILKKWFSAKAGSIAGNLQVICNVGSGAETKVIESQVGTGKYRVDTGEHVLLVDKASGSLLEGEAVLTLDGVRVKKLNQYRAYFFDGSDSAVWRDSDGEVIGTFIPALSVEDGDVGAPADSTATFIVTHETADSDDNQVLTIEIDDPGYGYDSAPTVTFTTGTGSTATATATINGLGQVDGVTLDTAGSYTDAEAASGITATASAP